MLVLDKIMPIRASKNKKKASKTKKYQNLLA